VLHNPTIQCIADRFRYCTLENDEAMRIAAMRGDSVLRANPWHPYNSIIFKSLDLLMSGTVETAALADFID